MIVYILIALFLVFLNGFFLFIALVLSKTWSNTVVSLAMACIFGLMLIILRIFTGISTVNMWNNVALGFAGYIVAYYWFFWDFRKTHPKLNISFFSYLHLKARSGKVTYEEVSNEETIKNLLETSGLSKKSEVDKLLEEPVTGAFWGWSTWILNLWMYMFITAGAAENPTIGHFLSKFFSGLLGEEGCLPVITAFVIISLIVYFKNKSSKSQDEKIMLETRDKLVEYFRKNGYTSEQIQIELNKLIDETVKSDEFNRQMNVFTKNEIDEWNRFLATKPSEEKRKTNLNKMFKKKIGKSYDDLVWQFVNKNMEKKLEAERLYSSFRALSGKTKKQSR